MAETRTPPVINPAADVGEQLRHIVGDMGTVEDADGGYRIMVCHTRAFPWDDVFKLLIYRGYKTSIGSQKAALQKADLFIEATR